MKTVSRGLSGKETGLQLCWKLGRRCILELVSMLLNKM